MIIGEYSKAACKGYWNCSIIDLVAGVELSSACCKHKGAALRSAKAMLKRRGLMVVVGETFLVDTPRDKISGRKSILKC
jgi:hypothetical protein